MHEVPSDIEFYERMILDSSSLAILQVQEGCITYANPAARVLFSGDKDAVLDGQVIDGRLVCENVNIKAVLDDALAKNAIGQQKSCMVVNADGNQLPVQLAVMPLLHQKQGLLRIIVEKLAKTALESNEEGESVQEMKPDSASVEPEIETKQEQQQVKTNSPSIPVIIRKALANAAKGKLVTLLSIRLENYEQLEQALGEKNIHQIANDITDKLKSVLGKEVLLENSQPSLFHILVGTQNQAKLKQVADNLSHAMDELVIEVSEQVVQVATAISILPVDKLSHAELLHVRIEKTLARAAGKGLNHWHLFDSKEELAELACQGDASALVRYALENGRFKLLYQPVISLTGDKEEHYAVLLRIVDPSGKEVVAGQFAAEVDKIVLGAKMDRWVILQSIKQLVIHRKKVRKKAHLFIHLSSASLQDKTLLPWVLGVLQKIPVGADSLVFQFSEKNAMRYREDIQRLLQGSKKVGFRTSLCDFGLSLKPMKTAEELSTDYVRLDASLTNNLEDDKVQEESVTEMIKALAKLNRRTIAVPVENPNALSAFWRTQVDYVQGFFVQQPKPDMDYDFSMDE
ncbi:cyclic di-GMP-binding protein FimX [Kistimonas scapharcae]|uniref:Cyclic di-GMP-binding protein FimX n=1 Tax=Kistimonas scapharcae TaxID=1036133 RepID=A0ABP8V593_9GAMM